MTCVSTSTVHAWKPGAKLAHEAEALPAVTGCTASPALMNAASVPAAPEGLCTLPPACTSEALGVGCCFLVCWPPRGDGVWWVLSKCPLCRPAACASSTAGAESCRKHNDSPAEKLNNHLQTAAINCCYKEPLCLCHGSMSGQCMTSVLASLWLAGARHRGSGHQRSILQASTACLHLAKAQAIA